MTNVYKVPLQFVDFLKNQVGTEGSRLNLDVNDADENTIVGIEEWQSPEFKFLHDSYPEESAMFEIIPYNPKPRVSPF